MISFRTRNESIASSVSIIAIIVLLGTALWYWLPLPSLQSYQVKSNERQLATARKSIDAAQDDRKKAEAEVAPSLWSGTPEEVAPQALSQVTGLAKERALKLVAFRPQKPVDIKGLTQITFGITLDGPFPNTVQFVKDLEQANLKLAVSTVQIASADQASDRVTGTVSVVAYIKGAATPATSGDKNVKKP